MIRIITSSKFRDLAYLVEQLDAANLIGNFLGKDGIAGWALDLDLAFRHDCVCQCGGWREWALNSLSLLKSSSQLPNSRGS